MIQLNLFLKNKRIVLREMLESDWMAIYALYNKPQTVRYNPGGYPENQQSVMELVKTWAAQRLDDERKSYTFFISDSHDESFIGVISLELGKKKYRNAEVWYELEPEKWGNGYATESLKAIIKFGFDSLNLHRIECGCSIQNIASIKVMEEAQMTKEAMHRSLLPLQDGWHDGCTYSILEDELHV